MTFLSWLLYFADVVNELHLLVRGVFVCSTLLLGFFFIYYCSYSNYKPLEDFHKTITKPVLKWAIVGFVISAMLAVFVPKKDTLFMIAGVEATNTVITSDANKQIIDKIYEAVNKQLDVMIKE